MKGLLYMFIIAAVATACSNEPGYVVTGTIDGVDSGVAMIQKRQSGGFVMIDSATIEKGTFKMDGFIEYPQLVFLTIKDKRGGVNFFLENSRISIAGNVDSLWTASVTGSSAHTEYETYIASFDESNNKMREVYERYREAMQAGNSELAAAAEKEFTELENQQLQSRKEFISNNPKSFVTPLVLDEITYYLDAPELEKMLNGLDSTLNADETIVDLRKKLVALKAVAIGQKAPDFTLNDVNGNPVSLYSKVGGKNKLLLVDFWAAWCGPCRRENPNVVKVWQEYNKKGFDVFGVSLDMKEDAWKKAIEDDKLTWTHVSELKRFNTLPVELYAVSAIPSNFLLDENGIIIAHNVFGDELAARIKEALGTK